MNERPAMPKTPSPDACDVKLLRYSRIVSLYCGGRKLLKIASSSDWRVDSNVGNAAKTASDTASSGTSERSVVSVIDEATSWSCASFMRAPANRKSVRQRSIR